MSAFDSYEQSPPKLIAGVRCLDFLNTVEWRGRPEAREDRLTSYGEFVAWARAANVVDKLEKANLLAQATKSPRGAAKTLADTLQAREALASLFGAGDIKPAKALATVNDILARDRFSLRLASDDTGIRAEWNLDRYDLRRPLLILLREAADLLSSPKRARVHHCSNDQCQWIFLDTSRNMSRRWCQMESCGNNAKARTHYQRHRVES